MNRLICGFDPFLTTDNCLKVDDVGFLVFFFIVSEAFDEIINNPWLTSLLYIFIFIPTIFIYYKVLIIVICIEISYLASVCFLRKSIPIEELTKFNFMIARIFRKKDLMAFWVTLEIAFLSSKCLN